MEGDRDKAESTVVTESKMSKEPSTTTKSNSESNPNPVKQAHSDDDSGCALEEYTWVPPGLKPDQVGTNDNNVVVALLDVYFLLLCCVTLSLWAPNITAKARVI